MVPVSHSYGVIMSFDPDQLAAYSDTPYPTSRCDGMSTLFQCQQFSLVDCIKSHQTRWKKCVQLLQLYSRHCMVDLVPCGLSWEQLIICFWMSKIPLFGRGFPASIKKRLQRLEIVVHLHHFQEDWAEMLDEMIHNQSVLMAPICPELYQLYMKAFDNLIRSMADNVDEICPILREQTIILSRLKSHPQSHGIDFKELLTFGPLNIQHFDLESQEVASMVIDFEQGNETWLISYLLQVQITSRYHQAMTRMESKRRTGQIQSVLSNVKFVRMVATDVSNKYYDILQYPQSLYDQQGSYQYHFHEVELTIDTENYRCILDTIVLCFFFPNSFDE